MNSTSEASIPEKKGQDFWKAICASIESQKQAPPLVPVSRAQKIPLSIAQERLWLLEKIGSNSAYNIPYTFQIRGSLNPQILEKSLEEIVRRHESLRVCFHEVDDQPVQVIANDNTDLLSIVDLQNLASEQQELEAEKLVQNNIDQPFNLSQFPLLRAILIQLNREEFILSLCVHHIVFDGWSEGLFFAELTSIYKTLSENFLPVLPEFPIQYADFAIWQRKWIKTDALSSQFSYWEEQLKDCPPLKLPTDYVQPSFPSTNGARQTLWLSSSLTNSLRTLSQESDTTLFVTLLAAFQTLLYRYVGQEDITICSPVAGRNRPEIQGLIGYFNNIIPIRCTLSRDPSFRELLERVRLSTLGALEHQDIPFQQLGNIRNLILPSISKSLFTLMGDQSQLLLLPDLQVDLMDFSRKSADFDISFFWEERRDQLIGSLEYKTDLFKSETIYGLLKNYQALLESVIDNPDRSISSIQLPEGVEYKHANGEFSQSKSSLSDAKAVPQTLAEQKIAEIWKEVLGLNTVGIHDNFFEIGGGSLLLVQVHLKLKEAFDLDFSPIDLFKYPTIQSLGQYLTQEQPEEFSSRAVQDRAQCQKLRRQQLMQRRKQRR